MESKLFTVAIIPAKMTSQRLRRKNMKDLCGNPLIYYSVEVAKQVDLIDEIFVSSEDNLMLDTAIQLGSKIVKRPEYLSSPEITNQDVLKHAYSEIIEQNDDVPDLVVLLQPTHPLRFPKPIFDAINIMKENKEYDSLFSVMHTDELRGKIVENEFIPEFKLPRDKKSEPEMFKNTGSFYIFRPAKTFLTGTFFGEKIYPFVLEKSPFEIDIDYPSDLALARSLLDSNKECFPHFDIDSSLEME